MAFLFVRCICVDVYNLWIEKGEVQGICSNVEMTAARPLKTFVFPGGKYACVDTNSTTHPYLRFALFFHIDREGRA